MHRLPCIMQKVTRMSSRNLSKLDVWWRLVTVPAQYMHSSVKLQTKHYHPNYKQRMNTFSKQQCRYSSNVIKSPNGNIEIPGKLIPEMVWDTVDSFPEAKAVKCGITGRTYKYAELQKLSFRFANALRRSGFSNGEVIALILPNCPEFAIITLGALEAELVVSFVNHVYTADEICHQLKDSGSVCVVAGLEQLDTVLKAVDKIETNQSKQIRNVIAVDIGNPQALPRNVIRFSEMIADSVDCSKKNTQSVKSSSLAFLPYSSGTTGLSKGVCLSHRNIVGNVYQISTFEGMEFYSPVDGQDSVLGLLPFYHIYGLVVILLNSLKNGSNVITLPKFEQDSFISTLEKDKLSILMLVPPLVLFLGASPKVKSDHLSNVRHIFSGAAPLGASDLEKVKTKLPSHNYCNISQGYGMTETSPVLTLPPQPTKNMDTVGVPVPNTMGKIVDPNTGAVLGPNQSGELCFRGPQVMLGYHNNPKATAEMIDADGWLHTGDIGYYDEDNHFYIQDRLKELIKVKGFQVPPAELEELLRTHPSISDVGVIGVPCPRAGEVPVAYIVTQKGKKLTVEQVKDFLSERVARHKQVSEVFFTDSIPKSAAGKILRKDLRQIYKNSQS